MLSMNPMVKQIIESNTTSDNVSFLNDNRICLCRHEKLHPLPARKGKWISEILYRDLKKSFNTTHLDKSLQT